MEKKDAQGVRQYRAANQEIKEGMKKAKMNWIEEHYQDIEDSGRDVTVARCVVFRVGANTMPRSGAIQFP